MAGTLEEIVSALAARRQRLGKSQTAVAQQMGTTQSAVSEIETLQTIPRIATLQRYAEACGGKVRVELDLPDVEDEAAEIAGGGFNDHAYLAVHDHGGIGYAGLDRGRAFEFAFNTGSVVVRLPVVGDYRPTEGT